MAESAALLVDEVFPEQPVRQWVYVERPDGTRSFRWVKAPISAELSALAGRIAGRVGGFLERRGLLERDTESASLAELALGEEPMQALLAHWITYRIALGPRAGRKVFTLQTLPPGDEGCGDHGVFAPNSAHRARVTKAHRGKGASAQAAPETDRSSPAERRAAMTWVQRLKRVFGIDLQTCTACGGAMRIPACSPRSRAHASASSWESLSAP